MIESEMSRIERTPPWVDFFMGKIVPRVMSWTFILFGAAISTWGVQNLLRARESLDWPKASGQIVSSHVSTDRSKESDGVSYRARIEYEFLVKQRKFTGTRIAYGDYGSSFRSVHEEIAKRYSKGKTVEVFYRPSDPKECLLEPGVKGQTWYLPFFGLVFIFPGVLIPILIKQSAKK